MSITPLFRLQSDALSRLDVMNDSERQTLEIQEHLQAELAALKAELERVRARSKDEHDILTTENEELNKNISNSKVYTDR